ncbi:hypothetical protein PHMEG_0001674 [Phytophthora megakarya]|uniref:Uncharacterized protein n=1 Tax=Phytophthora megakarya TaxID=4795 RepID=A0A225X2J3_9STRA|nr:hypothetical protein PHMEG_0001674 [Phytophthora megakarya]
MSVEMSAKYMDSSSSSSLSSDSDDLSSSSSSVISSSSSESDSDTPRASVKKKTAKQVDMEVSDYADDSDLDSATSGGKKKKKKPAPKRSPTKANKTQKTASVAPPPNLPPPPPPPSPPPAAPDEDSSSNSSFSSSSSDSSEMSDSETIPAPPPLPPGTNSTGASSGAASMKPPRRRAAMKKKVSGSSPSSLKVTLKLPPGFIKTGSGADANKQNFQGTDTATKRARTSTLARKAKPASGSRATKKTQVSGRIESAVAGQGAVPVAQMNGAAPVGTSILPKLIPTGPTVPAGEVRGAKELSLVDPALVRDNPEEMIESNIPAHFNDPYAHGGDILRLLDMFFFCDENGYVRSICYSTILLLIVLYILCCSKAISLEILDRPKEQRPKIMGFGTLVEHLPVSERPLPVRPILASPAFPSRSKKRPRADSASSTPAKSSASRSRARPRGNALFITLVFAYSNYYCVSRSSSCRQQQ